MKYLMNLEGLLVVHMRVLVLLNEGIVNDLRTEQMHRGLLAVLQVVFQEYYLGLDGDGLWGV